MRSSTVKVSYYGRILVFSLACFGLFSAVSTLGAHAFEESQPLPSRISALLFKPANYIEPLAPPPLALVVNNSGDAADNNVGDGICDTDPSPGSQCTLRAAIQEANAVAGADSIGFSLPDGTTITLNSALPDISSDLTITGPGESQLTIARSSVGGTPNFRLLTINGSIVSISGLTLTNGRSANGTNAAVGTNGAPGGGISNTGTLTLNNVTLNGNRTGNGGDGSSQGGDGGGGGAIHNTGTLNLTNCHVTNNLTGNGGNGPTPGVRGIGGGIYSPGGIVNLKNVVITGNTAQAGGGIYSFSTLRVNLSRISTNSAGSGAGILSGTSLVLYNSTISSNTATDVTGSGGGIFISAGSSQLANATISSNSAPAGAGIENAATVTLRNVTITLNTASTLGGGVHNNAGVMNFANTILAGNTAPANPDGNGNFNSLDNNLIGNTNGLTISGTTTHNLNNVNPKLAGLVDGGSGIPTHALLPGSPALDAGSDANLPSDVFDLDNDGNTAEPVPFDTRGPGFLRVVDGPDANTTATTDIGAVEAQLSIGDIPNQVINEDGTFAITFDIGGGAQIEAVLAASSNTTLVPNLPANLSITGSGSSRTLTIHPVANLFGTTNIAVSVSGDAESMLDNFLLTVNPVADTPSVTNSSTTLNTQTTTGLVITRNAADGAEVTHFKITSITNGTLFQNNGTTPIASNSFITAAQGAAGLKFTPTTGSTATGSFSVQAATAANNANLGGGVVAATITVTGGGNTAPSFTKGPNQTVNEDSGAKSVTNWATNISAGPPSESGQTLTFQVTSNSNTALFSAQPAVSPTGTLTFTPAANAAGTASITLVLKDNGGGSDTSPAQTFTITVSAVNDAPVNTVPGSQTVNTGTSLTFSSGSGNRISVADIDAGSSLIRVTLNLTNGVATLSSIAGLSFTTGDGTADATMTFTGTTTSINAALNGLSFTPSIGSGDALLQIITNDLGNTGSGGALSDTDSVLINVTSSAALIKFSSATFNTNESAGVTTITVQRTGLTSTAVTVHYETADHSESIGVFPCSTVNGIASSRCDYTTAIGTISFAAGETSKTFKVLISQDAYVEGPEGVTLTLSDPTGGAQLASPSTAMLIIADDATEPPTNVIDDAATFVRQQYHDFLNREPDAGGLNFWINEITSCGSDAQCIEVKRINVSAAFFLSIEFQETGVLVFRAYKAAYRNLPGAPVPLHFNEYLPDAQQIAQGVQVGVGNWQAQLEANKTAFLTDFVTRTRFTNGFPTSLTPAQFVDGLFLNTGITPTSAERQAAINEFGGAGTSADTAARVRALRRVVENDAYKDAETNRAFVLMQYFGYMRRNPDANPDTNYDGYNFWLGKLNQFDGNFVDAEMVKAFIISGEYRGRFGTP